MSKSGSDTIDTASNIALDPTLRTEKLIFLDNAVRLKMKKRNHPQAPAAPSFDAEQVRKMVQSELATKKETSETAWWSKPWIGNAAAVLALLLSIISYRFFADQDIRQHNAKDLDTQISNEVAKQLEPFNQRLFSLGEDIGKIKNSLGIAQERKSGSGFLEKFAKMDSSQLRNNAKALTDNVKEARNIGGLEQLSTVDEIQKKLASTQLTTPDELRAAFALINYNSLIREKNGQFPDVAMVRRRDCTAFKIRSDGDRTPIREIRAHLRGAINNLNGCTQLLDGLAIEGGTFINAVVEYDGGATSLTNVTFVNCLFEFSFPIKEQVHPSGRQLAGQVLAGNIGSKPRFEAKVTS